MFFFLSNQAIYLTWKCASGRKRVHFLVSDLGEWSKNGVFCFFLTWKWASRHNGVQFLISHLATRLRTRRRLDPPDPQIIRKTKCLAAFLTLGVPVSSFFGLTLSRSLFYVSLFYSSLLFISFHTVGSLTSKLPLIIEIHIYNYIYGIVYTFVFEIYIYI